MPAAMNPGPGMVSGDGSIAGIATMLVTLTAIAFVSARALAPRR